MESTCSSINSVGCRTVTTCSAVACHAGPAAPAGGAPSGGGPPQSCMAPQSTARAAARPALTQRRARGLGRTAMRLQKEGTPLRAHRTSGRATVKVTRSIHQNFSCSSWVVAYLGSLKCTEKLWWSTDCEASVPLSSSRFGRELITKAECRGTAQHGTATAARQGKTGGWAGTHWSRGGP